MGINELEKFLKSGKIEILGTDIVRSGYDYISKYCNDNEECIGKAIERSKTQEI